MSFISRCMLRQSSWLPFSRFSSAPSYSVLRCLNYSSQGGLLTVCDSSKVSLPSSETKRDISVTPDTALKYLEKDKHSHTKEWLWERGTAVGLVLCFPAAFILPFPIVDFTVTTLGVFHGHLGVEAVFTDYAHSHTLRKFVNSLTYLASFFIWGSLMYFNYADVGICNAVKMLWSA